MDRSRLRSILADEGLARSAAVRIKGLKKVDGEWMLDTGVGQVDLNGVLRGLGGLPASGDTVTLWVFSYGYDSEAEAAARDAWLDEDSSREWNDWYGGPEGAWLKANADFMKGAFGKFFPSEAAAIKNARGYKRPLFVGRVKVPLKELKPSGKTTRQLMFLPKAGQYKKPVPGKDVTTGGKYTWVDGSKTKTGVSITEPV